MQSSPDLESVVFPAWSIPKPLAVFPAWRLLWSVPNILVCLWPNAPVFPLEKHFGNVMEPFSVTLSSHVSSDSLIPISRLPGQESRCGSPARVLQDKTGRGLRVIFQARIPFLGSAPLDPIPLPARRCCSLGCFIPGFLIPRFCPQAIAHYEQAADYYKGEESNRQVLGIGRKGWSRDASQTLPQPTHF